MLAGSPCPPLPRLVGASVLLGLAAVVPAPAPAASGADGCGTRVCAVQDEALFHRWPSVKPLRWGYGMTVRDDLAAHWYALAARAGDARAMFNYGLMLLRGRGVEADPGHAQSWLERSFALGTVRAALALGDLARLGGAAPADPRLAAAYYRFAAEAGDVQGMHALANLYASGAGVRQSGAEAYFWYLLAAGRGHLPSEAPRSRLAGVLPSALAVRAERRADKWSPPGR